MEMWITRYALTDGVKKESGVVEGGYFLSNKRVCVFDKVGVDAHATEEAARAAAESMRVKKIASLRKQIAKLEGMKF